MPETFPSDQDLIVGCIEGKRDSWDAFVERFSRLIYWGIFKALEGTAFQESTDLCNEIFQEIFTRLVERDELNSLRELTSVRKFLSVMTCRATLDKLKALRRQEKSRVDMEKIILNEESGEESVMETALEGAASNPADDVISKEREGVIGEVLETLSLKERACVEFYYVDGKAHREIGEILGMPQDTVSSIIRRAKEKLRLRLADKGFLE